MKIRATLLLLVALLALHAQPAYDLLIVNGRIVDGSGNAWFYGDIAIRGDRIARIAPAGLLTGAAARERIDARGLPAAPRPRAPRAPRPPPRPPPRPRRARAHRRSRPHRHPRLHRYPGPIRRRAPH